MDIEIGLLSKKQAQLSLAYHKKRGYTDLKIVKYYEENDNRPLYAITGIKSKKFGIFGA